MDNDDIVKKLLTERFGYKNVDELMNTKGDFRDIASFTDAEKEECQPLIKKIEELHKIGRTQGFLAFEEEMEHEQDIFFKEAFIMAADAYEQDVIRKVLQKAIIAEKPEGAKLLGRLLTIHGILCIVRGEASTNQQHEYLPGGC